MSSDPAEAERLRELYASRVGSELDEADGGEGSHRASWSGDALARIVFVKGAVSASDLEAGRAFAGADGDAARRAAAALGLDSTGVLFICSRRAGEDGSAIERLAVQLEAADPAFVIATDVPAAVDVAAALGTGALTPGVPIDVNGRRIVAVDGLEQSLGDERRKRTVWRQMRSVTADGR